MIGALMRYGGTAAKIKTMYGKRLKQQDFDRLFAMGSVSDAAEFLRQSPAWSDAFVDYDVKLGDHAELERRLDRVVSAEFERIYRFMSSQDHPLMCGMIERAEQQELLRFMLQWSAGRAHEYQCEMPSYFAAHCLTDYSQLSSLSDLEQFWTVIADSMYYPSLAQLPRQKNAPPDYTAAKTVMDARYYTNIFKIIKKTYSGDTAVKLGDGFGAEVDLLNIVSIIRVKQFFPSMGDGIADYLVPLRRKLSVDTLRRMADAPDGDAVLDIVKETHYGKLFAGRQFDIIDDYAADHLYRFHRKLLAAPVPSVYTPIAYLHLKQVELQNIKKTIECIRYGVSPAAAGIYLAGVTTA